MTMTSDALTPGQPVTLIDGVRRLVAPNPGMMTGPGTNTYLIGNDELAVIDPGPAIDQHVDAILVAAADAPIRWILATHTHSDHSPAVAALKAQTGAEVWGLPAPVGYHQDSTFAPTHLPADGERLTVDTQTLRVIHTPGHASNHLCFFIEETGWLFTGDHIINGSTVVIDPPDGSMSDYLASLSRLAELPLTAIAGGHGEVLDTPQEAIRALIEHRLAREARVLNALEAGRAQSSADLVAASYPGLAPALHRLAERSLLAHLIKLGEDGAALERSDGWVRTG